MPVKWVKLCQVPINDLTQQLKAQENSMSKVHSRLAYNYSWLQCTDNVFKHILEAEQTLWMKRDGHCLACAHSLVSLCKFACVVLEFSHLFPLEGDHVPHIFAVQALPGSCSTRQSLPEVSRTWWLFWGGLEPFLGL